MFEISVIIPAHNSQIHLKKSLNSIFLSSFQDYEIIIVENGSKDQTLKVAADILSSNLPTSKYKLISIPEADVSKARNLGIEASKGKYLFFLDADDYISPNTLKSLYITAEKNNSDISYCPFDRIIQIGEKIRQIRYEELFNIKEYETSGVKFLKDFIKGNKWIMTGNNIIRSDLIKNHSIKFPEGYFGGEDQYFFMKALAFAKKVSFTPKGRMYYLQHESGTLANSDKVLDSLVVYKLFANELENNYFLLTNNDRDKLLKLIRNFKIPYLFVRAFYRLARVLEYGDFAKVLKKNKKKYNISFPIPVKSKFWFPTFVGYFSLKYFPKLFYILSKKINKV